MVRLSHEGVIRGASEIYFELSCTAHSQLCRHPLDDG